MKRLRHPVRAIREPFGTAGLILACVAIVLALTGAAFAAGKLTGKQKKEVEKIAKKFAKAGPPGMTGPAGPAGAPGAGGKEGPAGTNGTNGTNGKDGETGFTETLPSGKTETGEWALIGDASTAHAHFGNAVSFNIPLVSPPAVHYLRASGLEPVLNGTEEEEVAQPACPGTASEPVAEPGSLCIYTSAEQNTAKHPIPTIILPKVDSFATGGVGFGPNQADPYGFGIFTLSEEEGPVAATGTWAVTAE